MAAAGLPGPAATGVMQTIHHASPQGSAAAENGRHALHGARFFVSLVAALLLLGGWLPAHAETELKNVQALVDAGAPSLALDLVNSSQPDPAKAPDEWMRWERMRIAILVQKKAWSRIDVRLQTLPAGLPADFSRWAGTQRASALLQLDRAAEARHLLRQLIWGGEAVPEQLMRWRQQVIRSYLVEHAKDDAYSAMLRYHQDYGEKGEEGTLLRARVMLSSGLPADAAALLTKLKGPEARLLLLLARLRAKTEAAKDVLPAARKIARAKGVDDGVQALAYAVAAEAADAEDKYAIEAIVLEKLFGAGQADFPEHELFDLSPNRLWDAYLKYAHQVGNRQQLLMGDDTAWSKAAESAGRKYPIRRKSIYALLALKANTPQVRQRAHIELARALLDDKHGVQLLRALYLDSHRFEPITQIPDGVRRILTDDAIGHGDLALASRLQQGLAEPPKGVDRVVWQLRRAKIFILGGDGERGAQLLQQLIKDNPTMPKPQRDRLMQVLFDLQSVGFNDQAYTMFQMLLGQTQALQARRELLYWMGDSRKAQARYPEAARLYLRSAILGDPKATDQWAQTARYQAAKMLAEAGMNDDARRQYELLLAVTTDPARQALLQRDMQQLWLKRQTKPETAATSMP